MARDLAKDMMKRKATYRNGAPKTLDVKDEDNMELAALLQERYQYIIETQEQLAFSPDKVRYLLLPEIDSKGLSSIFHLSPPLIPLVRPFCIFFK
jgi:hypothetical protein